MIQLTVLYGHPQDPAAFDRYYEEKHVPLVKRLPRLRGFTATRPSTLNPQEQSSYYLIAALYFEDMEEFQAALQSPEGQVAAEDVHNFATGGATLLVGEVRAFEPAVID
jgi:uncharacterized protein (TIGR02118 family)